MENGLSAADVALLSKDDGGMWGGSSMMWIFALLILAGGGFGFGNRGLGYENYATSAEVQRGFDTQNLQAQTRDIMNTSTLNATNAINAIKDGNAALIREFGNVETALTALSGKQQECCCEILRAIDGVNYNGALNTSAINANITAQAQKILDTITGNRMADMQAQINQLQLAQAMTGVVRYPLMTTFSSGCNPFGCNCTTTTTGGTTTTAG